MGKGDELRGERGRKTKKGSWGEKEKRVEEEVRTIFARRKEETKRQKEGGKLGKSC